MPSQHVRFFSSSPMESSQKSERESSNKVTVSRRQIPNPPSRLRFRIKVRATAIKRRENPDGIERRKSERYEDAGGNRTEVSHGGSFGSPRGLRGLRALPRGRAVHVYRAHDVSVDGGARSRGYAQQRAASGGEERGECRAIWIFSRATPRGVEVHAPGTPASSRRGRSHGPRDAPRGPLDAKHLTVGTPRPSQSRRSSRRKRRCNPRSARTTSCDARLNA